VKITFGRHAQPNHAVQEIWHPKYFQWELAVERRNQRDWIYSTFQPLTSTTRFALPRSLARYVAVISRFSPGISEM
jgi:hypothetical protein